MIHFKINTYEDLTARVAELNSIKDKQELELKSNLKKVQQSFQLKHLLKSTVKDLANDKEFRQDGIKAATGMATDLVLGRLFNKNSSVRGFITTLLVEKLALPLIKNNKDKVLSFITDLLAKHKNKDEEL
jgi:hypothetical protein